MADPAEERRLDGDDLLATLVAEAPVSTALPSTRTALCQAPVRVRDVSAVLARDGQASPYASIRSELKG